MKRKIIIMLIATMIPLFASAASISWGTSVHGDGAYTYPIPAVSETFHATYGIAYLVQGNDPSIFTYDETLRDQLSATNPDQSYVNAVGSNGPAKSNNNGDNVKFDIRAGSTHVNISSTETQDYFFIILMDDADSYYDVEYEHYLVSTVKQGKGYESFGDTNTPLIWTEEEVSSFKWQKIKKTPSSISWGTSVHGDGAYTYPIPAVSETFDATYGIAYLVQGNDPSIFTYDETLRDQLSATNPDQSYVNVVGSNGPAKSNTNGDNVKFDIRAGSTHMNISSTETQDYFFIILMDDADSYNDIEYEHYLVSTVKQGKGYNKYNTTNTPLIWTEEEVSSLEWQKIEKPSGSISWGTSVHGDGAYTYPIPAVSETFDATYGIAYLVQGNDPSIFTYDETLRDQLSATNPDQSYVNAVGSNGPAKSNYNADNVKFDIRAGSTHKNISTTKTLDYFFIILMDDADSYYDVEYEHYLVSTVKQGKGYKSFGDVNTPLIWTEEEVSSLKWHKIGEEPRIMIKAKMPYEWDGSLRAYAWYYDPTGVKKYISDEGSSQTEPITVAMEDDGNGWWHLTFEPLQTLVGISFTDAKNPSDANFITAEVNNITETSYYEVSASDDATPKNYAPIINKSFNGSSELQSIFEGHNRSTIPVNIDVFATADSELTTGVMFDNDQTFIIGEGVNVELAPSENTDPIYGYTNQNKFHYLVLEDGAKIGSPDANVYSVDSLRIIYKITPDPETKFNKQWASIAAPFSAYINAPIDYSDANDDFNLSFKVTKGDAAGNYIPNAEPLVRGVDFETFTYSGELRADPEGVGQDNWKIPEKNKDQVGEVIQVLDNNSVHYCEFYTKVDASMALGYGAREMELFYDESGTVPTADNGWSMCAANKTYDDVYEKPTYYGSAPATAQFLQIFDPETTGFYTREFGADKIATGTAYVVQLVDDNATLSTKTSSEDVETYKFILTDNEGKELDRIYIASNTLSSKYRLAKMSSLVAAPQMVVNANNTDYTVYSTASTESENSFDIEISGLDTEGAKLVLASEGTEQVSINDKKAILESPISVENGTVNIVIGNKPTSVGGGITSGAKVYGINGAIVIESAEAGAEYIISDAAGVKVAGVMSADSATITKDAGVYIVGVNGIYTKVIVK